MSLIPLALIASARVFSDTTACTVSHSLFHRRWSHSASLCLRHRLAWQRRHCELFSLANQVKPRCQLRFLWRLYKLFPVSTHRVWQSTLCWLKRKTQKATTATLLRSDASLFSWLAGIIALHVPKVPVVERLLSVRKMQHNALPPTPQCWRMF